jgi:ribosomal protein S18 acetylase RimI-like enzyme
MISVREISNSDFDDVARIHKASFSHDHITSHYPDNLLITFYKEIAISNNYCYVAFSGGKLIGFVFAGRNTRQSVNNFISKNYLNLLMVVLAHPSFILSSMFGIFNRLITSKSNSQSIVTLLSIAVHPSFKHQGVGKELVSRFENDLKKNNEHVYKLSVRKKNDTAIKFYKKQGLTIVEYNEKSISFEKKL